MILLALNSLESDFMERHCLEAFERMGKRGKTEEPLEELLGRAEKRDQFAIRILGKMAAEEATETLVEFVSEDSNPQLQKIVFKALGEIGAPRRRSSRSRTSSIPRGTPGTSCPHAARALGLIGDTRAIDPLAGRARRGRFRRRPRRRRLGAPPDRHARSDRNGRRVRGRAPSSSPPRPRRPSSPSTRRRRPPDADRGSTDHSYLMPRARSPCRRILPCRKRLDRERHRRRARAARPNDRRAGRSRG